MIDQETLDAEIASIEDEFGPLDSVEILERLAGEIRPDTYDGGEVVGRAVAAELRRRALRLRNAGG